MVRNYIRKKPPPTYSLRDMEMAVLDVVNKNKTYREAEACYGIPISVIFHRIKGCKTSITKIGQGRNTCLPAETERSLVKCILSRSEMGYPCDKKELFDIIGQYVKFHYIKTQFTDGRPGEQWWTNFMKRHPILSLKKPELLQKCRMSVRQSEIIYDFYKKLESVIKTYNLDDYESKKFFIFNADESGFNNDPSRVRAIGQKGVPCSRVSGGAGRTSTSVLACVSAAGLPLPPLIVFKGGAVQGRWTSSLAYPGTLYAASAKGWMEEPQFFHWFSNGFVKYVKALREEKSLQDQTALLLYDGHSSHISIRILESALENNVQIIRLPSHLTDRLQPLDKSVFGPVKTAWDKLLVEHGKKMMGSEHTYLSKKQLTELLGLVWQKAITPKNVISGFVCTGIYPVDSAKFPKKLFDPIALKNYEKENNIEQNSSSDSVNKLVEFDVSLTQHKFKNQPVQNNSNNLNLLPSNSQWHLIANEPSTSGNLTRSPIVLENIVIVPAQKNLELQKHVTDPINENTDSISLNKSINITDDPETVTTCQNSILSSSISILFNLDLREKKIILPSQKKKVVPRLKQMQYGEVLTTQEVIQRLKEADERKKKPKPKKIKLEKKRKHKKYSTSEDEDINMAELLNEDIELNWNDDSIEEEIELISPLQITDMSVGNFILAQFKGVKRMATCYKYVCEILMIDVKTNEIQVLGFKSVNNDKTLFSPIPEDVSFIKLSQVIGIISSSKKLVDDKMKISFEKKVPVNEK